jgi:hypothetical protein
MQDSRLSESVADAFPYTEPGANHPPSARVPDLRPGLWAPTSGLWERSARLGTVP